MITLSSLQYINPSLKYSIKEYFSSANKILLYDILLFLSLKSKTPMLCSNKDLESFRELIDQSIKQDFNLKRYVSWAYDYISKYCKEGHRIPIAYLINDKVIEYCAKRDALSSDNLLYSQIMDQILVTEKECRRICTENDTSYAAAIRLLLRDNLLPDCFIAFKFYNNSDICFMLPNPEKYKLLCDILEPIFIFYTARNGLYNMKSLVEWNTSKIESWSFCPLFFRDNYLLKNIPEKYLKNAASDSGTAVHKVAEAIFKQYEDRKNKYTMDEIYASFIKTKAYQNLANKIEEKEHLEGLKTFFLGKFKEIVKPDSLLFSEILLYLPHSETLSFFGTPDLFIINDDICYLLDYKTSKINSYLDKNNSKYHKQLSLYANMIQHKYPAVKRVIPIIIYTRGLIVDLKEPIKTIVQDRASEVSYIKEQIKRNMFKSNPSSCFLCRAPDCESRSKSSIWDDNGVKIIK